MGSEPRDVFFFREGSLVMWNMDENEGQALLSFLKPFELKRLPDPVAIQESEALNYCYSDNK